MKIQNPLLITFSVFITFSVIPSIAQIQDIKQIVMESATGESVKGEKEKMALASTEYLINTRHFVFEADFGQGSAEMFVVVDSAVGMVQNGNRNNLEGRISQFTVKKNDKQKTLSVAIKIKSSVATADVFILLGAEGHGSATVRSESYAGNETIGGLSDFPGNYTFNGRLVEIGQARIYKGKSIIVK